MSVFVTCLYDIATVEKNSSRKSASFYLQCATFLKKLGRPIIIFTSADLFSRVNDAFGDAPHSTIIVRSFQEFAYFNRLAEMDAISRIHPYITRTPHKDTSLYKILIWNKSEFVGIVAKQYPQYDTFIWIDFGLEFVVKQHIADTNMANVISHFDDTHFYCTVLNPPSEYEYQNLPIFCEGWRFRQVGGFWAIGRKNVDFFVNFIREEINRILEAKYVCTEEDIMARFVFAHGDKCKLSFGDYDACIINWLGLTRKVHFIPSVLRKLQNNGQHKLALYGFEGLLDAHSKGNLPMTADDIFELLYYYFISLFFVDKLKSKEVVVQILRISLVNTRIRQLLMITESTDFKNFRHVLTKNELDLLSPFNYNNKPFFELMTSKCSPQLVICGGPNIFRPADLYNISV